MLMAKKTIRERTIQTVPKNQWLGKATRGGIDNDGDPVQTVRGGNIDWDNKGGVVVLKGERIGSALLMSQ